mmetsp:Transcript_83882/g.237914  ORF Transcript_83882/g.237914 Transcript_83882/m.237914 type:complete len:120 (-) Transcript_83882:510-869(-)
MDADAPDLPRAGASLGNVPRKSAGPISPSGTVSATEFLARCSATLQYRRVQAKRRQSDFRKLSSGESLSHKDQQAKVKHDQRRKDKKVRHTIDKKQKTVVSDVINRVDSRTTLDDGDPP